MPSVVIPANPTKLRQVRESLGVTQESLVRRAQGLQLRTYVRIEQGQGRARYDTATAILGAINEILREAEKPEMKLEDLEIRLF